MSTDVQVEEQKAEGLIDAAGRGIETTEARATTFIKDTTSQKQVRGFFRGNQMYAFMSFVLLLSFLFIAIVMRDPFVTDIFGLLFIAMFALFVHGILMNGVDDRRRRKEKEDGAYTDMRGDGQRVRGIPDIMRRSGPFGWTAALNCDQLTQEDKKAQCEFDGFTLSQQLGDFARWVNTNKNDRIIYAQDYRRLRDDKCNLFPREDLQTSCKLLKVKY